MFYSYNVGPAHVIVYSSEFYYFVGYGWEQIANQYEWLKSDLMEAAKPENQRVRPWIITMAHRPMYCTNAGERVEMETLSWYIQMHVLL